MKILIAGTGKMGSLIKETAQKNGNIVTGMVDAFDLSPLDTMEIPDVLIDFSHRDNLGWIAEYAAEYHVPVVCGTTGLTESDQQTLQKLSEQVPVFYSSNYSYGVAVLNELVRRATALLKDGYDMELVETHHNEKKDAPSGTAKTLLSIMNESGEFTPVYGRQGDVGARGKEIGVHSLRGGTEAGEHTVYYFGNNETITVSHHATNRVIFVNGALKAADYLVKQPAGMYGMNDLIG